MKTILKFDHFANLLLRRLCCINNWSLQCIDAYSWNRLAMSYGEHIHLWNLSFKNHNPFSQIMVYIETCYSCVLGCKFSSIYKIYKHKDNHKLLSPFLGKKLPPPTPPPPPSIFLKNRQNSIPHSLVKRGRPSYD